VLGLIAEVEQLVAQKTGMALEREVKVWGADGTVAGTIPSDQQR